LPRTHALLGGPVAIRVKVELLLDACTVVPVKSARAGSVHSCSIGTLRHNGFRLCNQSRLLKRVRSGKRLAVGEGFRVDTGARCMRIAYPSCCRKGLNSKNDDSGKRGRHGIRFRASHGKASALHECAVQVSTVLYRDTARLASENFQKG
jgi:hypothetical protein